MFGNTFIKANHDFGVPWCVFEVGHRQVFCESRRGDPLFKEVEDAVKQAGEPYPKLEHERMSDPGEAMFSIDGLVRSKDYPPREDPLVRMEKALLAIIERERPALKGGSVIAIDCRGGMRWEITFVHPLLPRHKNAGSFLPRIPLVMEQGWMPASKEEQDYLDELDRRCKQVIISSGAIDTEIHTITTWEKEVKPEKYGEFVRKEAKRIEGEILGNMKVMNIQAPMLKEEFLPTDPNKVIKSDDGKAVIMNLDDEGWNDEPHNRADGGT